MSRGRSENRPSQRTVRMAAVMLAFSMACPLPLAAEEPEEGDWLTWKWSTADDRPNAVALSGGFGTEQYVSRVITSPWNTRLACSAK